jgi:DNA repair exonuclease SbcCD nuclease subunit
MNFLIVGDTHFNNWKQFAQYTEDGLNSRLQEQLQLFTIIDKTCSELNIKNIVFVGDIFHIRGKVPPSVLKPVSECFKSLAQKYKCYIVAGNHDMEDKEGKFTSVFMLGYIDNVFVFDTPTVVDGFGFIPYQYDKDTFLSLVEDMGKNEAVNWLVTHHGIVNEANGYGDKNEVTTSEIEALTGKYIFNGHYHNSFQENNIINVGSAMGHSFSDANIDKFLFTHIDGNIDKIQVHISDFMDYKEDDRIYNGYVRIQCQEKDLQKSIKRVNKYKPKGITTIILPEEQEAIEQIKSYDLDDLIINRLKKKSLIKKFQLIQNSA